METLYVVKIGGNVIDDAQRLSGFLQLFAQLPGSAVLVHGGGKIATRIGEQLGIESRYINGRRITDDDTIDLVTMVYGGLVNKKVVAALQSLGCNAIGLTGADANVLPATKRPVGDIDYGWAGDVDQSMPGGERLRQMVAMGWVPVMAPLTHDSKGHMLNTNADTIASSVAVALSGAYRVRLMYCFEKPGVLLDVNDDTSVIAEITPDSYSRLREEGRLFAGMLPKLDNAFAAIRQGVSDVWIGQDTELLQAAAAGNRGTLIKT